VTFWVGLGAVYIELSCVLTAPAELRSVQQARAPVAAWALPDQTKQAP